MSSVLYVVMLAAFRLPAVETFEDLDWQPVYTEPADIQIQQSTLALVTHGSRRFDPLGQTRAAVVRTVAAMKTAGFPVIYLHDRYNPGNPPWMYLYDDWEPTAFVGSDIGHIRINLSQVEHVICLGGYYGQCERTTVSDVVQLWHADGFCHDFRVTQITDGVFTVGQHVDWNDSWRKPVREFLESELKSRHRDAVLSVSQILTRIDSFEDRIVFVERQLPPVPDDVNVAIDVFGRVVTVQAVSAEVPTLTFSFRRSDQFLDRTDFRVDFDGPQRWVRSRLSAPQEAPVSSPVIFSN